MSAFSKLLWYMCMFTFLGLKATGESSQHSWWYQTYGAHSQELLSYRNKVTLKTYLDANVSWISPSCSLSPVSQSPSAVELLCAKPGLHSVSIGVTDGSNSSLTQTLFFVPLDNSQDCFTWKVNFTVVGYQQNSSIQVFLQVWVGILDSGDGDNQQNELGLTEMFHSLGEQPTVIVRSHMPGTVFTVGFETSCKCWEFEIETSAMIFNEIAVDIHGQGVIAMGCGIRSRTLVLYDWRLNNQFLLVNHENLSFSQAAHPRLLKGGFFHGIAFIFHSGYSSITVDDFQSIMSIQIDDMPNLVIEDVALTMSSMYVLGGGRLFILRSDGQISVVNQNNYPGSMFQHIAVKNLFEEEVSIDLVVVWSQELNQTILISEDGGSSFQTQPQPTGRTKSVIIHPVHQEIEVLVEYQENMAQFVCFDLTHQSWRIQSAGFNFSGGNLTATYFPGAFSDTLIWEETALYYSPNSGVTTQPLSLLSSQSGTLIPVSLSEDAHIKHVSPGPHAQFTVLLSNNRLFYGTIGIGYAVEIQSGLQSNSVALLSFNVIGELKLVHLDDNGVNVRKVPTYSLLLSSLYPPPICPYLQWTHNIIQRVYYLDSMETLTFWAQLIPRPWQANKISFSLSDPSVVNYQLTNILIQTSIEGSVERNLTVQIQPKMLLPNISSERTGVKIAVVNENFACARPSQIVTQLSVRCPPFRHVRVKGYSEDINDCPSYENLVYNIPKEYYDPDLRWRVSVQGSEDKEVQYNQSLHGCPFRVPFVQPLKPILELYDGDNFVKVVDADFVVWEIHGRTDFKYTATAQQAGCLSAPQSWTQVTQDGSQPADAWTPQSYRHCFQEGGNQLDNNAPYQILNQSGVSSLSWHGHNGIYVFSVRVVGERYSFCDLTTTFAVEVYGATSNSYVGYIFLVITCLAGLAVLVSSYYCYRHKTGRHEKKE